MGVRAAFVAYVDLGGVRRTSRTPAVRPKFGVSAPTAVVFDMKVGALVVVRRVMACVCPRGLAWCRELCCFF